MDIYAMAPLSLGLEAAYYFLTSLTSLIAPLAGGSAAGLAVVVLTVAVRLVLLPVTVSQIKAELERERLAPLLAELQRRHGKDRARLQQEMAALYQREHASPLAGCLPTLVQLPVLMILYGVFISRTIASEPNALLTEPFLGVALGRSLLELLGSPAAAGAGALAVFAGLILILAGLAELSRRRMRASSKGNAIAAGTPPTPSAAGGHSTSTPGPGELLRLMQWLPYAVLIPAAVVPLAAGLYLAASMAWTAVERPLVRRVLTARHTPGAAGGAPALPSR